MIVCPNCNHQNPDSAVQCEACYTPLPTSTTCPNCGASVQSDASFCGQCGFNLKSVAPAASAVEAPVAIATPLPITPELLPPDPLIVPEVVVPEPITPNPATPESAVPDIGVQAFPASASNAPVAVPNPAEDTSNQPLEGVEPIPAGAAANEAAVNEGQTQLQQQSARLLHLQTNTLIELPQGLSVIHIGKPNDRIPPDIDLSGFPNSEIVSRIHADVRLEVDTYYIEDVGSSNGTYINNLPLTIGNRHRLRPGDRISLGKGDKVTFLFQIS